MEKIEYEFSSAQPHLVFQIGPFACAPLGFASQLANNLGTTYYSFQAAFRYALHDMSYRGETPDMSAWDKVNDTMLGWAETSLKEGANVVLDNYYYTRESRVALCALAQECGAISVGLAMETSLDQLESRAKEWHSVGLLKEVNPNMWPQPPKDLVARTVKELDWPVAEDEPIDHLLETLSRKDSCLVVDRVLTKMYYKFLLEHRE